MKYSQTKIAKLINRNRSTISRELNRNSVEQIIKDRKVVIYVPKIANDFYRRRRIFSKHINIQKEIKKIIYSGINKDYSFEQISGLAKKNGENFPCKSTLYNYQHKNLLTFNKRAYRLSLTKQKRKPNTMSRLKEQLTFSIHQLPQHVIRKRESGHFELDLIESASMDQDKGYIITLVERISTKTFTKFIPNKKASEVNKFIYSILKNNRIKTIITDNGFEFNRLYEFKNIKIYYTDPGCPYQKGLVERINKSFREYIIKDKKFNQNIKKPLTVYTKMINERPIKKLNFNTPQEVYNLLHR